MSKNYSLMAGTQFIDSIRSTGYQSTGHALGELIDNSIQASAKEICILVEVRTEKIKQRNRETITRIAVVDDGIGMSPELLRSSLLFGEGTNFGKKNSLGKFGVGLPQASLSQAKIIDAWSWQEGINNAYHTGFNINDDAWRSSGAEIPEPRIESIPEPWISHANIKSNHGTIIIWSNLDRITWKGARTLYENAELLIGRMYRNWIKDGKVQIKYKTIQGTTGKILDERDIRAVDPLYLMEGTAVDEFLPEEWIPMFEKVAEKNMDVTYGDVTSTITLRTSVAIEEIRKRVNKKDQAGKEKYGKHAAKNVGLSIVREERELELVTDWTANTSNRKDPRHRWWGAEICFRSELDDLFGVTNNKQSATNLSRMWDKTIEDYMFPGETKEEARERLRDEDPATSINLNIAEEIRIMIKHACDFIPSGESNNSNNIKTTRTFVEESATDLTKKMAEKGYVGYSDEQESLPAEEKKKELIDAYTSYGIPEEEISNIIEGYITHHNKYHFTKVKMPGENSFFIPRFDAGAIVIMLNTAHPMFNKLFDVFAYIDENKEYTPQQLKDMLINIYDSIKLMLASWSRMEDVALKDDNTDPSEFRNTWGKYARNLDKGDLQ